MSESVEHDCGVAVCVTGTSLSVVVGLTVDTAILVSAGVTVLYTMIGQMISVAYTDVLQLLFITLGLVRPWLKRVE